MGNIYIFKIPPAFSYIAPQKFKAILLDLIQSFAGSPFSSLFCKIGILANIFGFSDFFSLQEKKKYLKNKVNVV